MPGLTLIFGFSCVYIAGGLPMLLPTLWAARAGEFSLEETCFVLMDLWGMTRFVEPPLLGAEPFMAPFLPPVFAPAAPGNMDAKAWPVPSSYDRLCVSGMRPHQKLKLFQKKVYV